MNDTTRDDAELAVAEVFDDAGDDASGLDCVECGFSFDMEHHSSDQGLCRDCWDRLRRERRTLELAGDGEGGS